MNRRDFLEFMGVSGVSIALFSTLSGFAAVSRRNAQFPFQPLAPSSLDDLQLANGFNSQVLLRWGDSLTDHGLKFGFNNDFLALIPLSRNESVLWVNHESIDPIFVSGYRAGMARTKAQVETEMREVGGSLVHVRYQNNQWQVIANSPFNRRLDAFTRIPFSGNSKIAGSAVAVGTLAGCGGGVTPWNTILSCEENYQDFFGENTYLNGAPVFTKSELGWEKFFNHPPEHYGWVVEINPLTGAAKKLTALGRFAHEAATVVTAHDGRAVIYMGDDKANECIYKFIAAKPGSLEEGELFVANIHKGEWISLAWEKNEILRKMFSSPTEALIRTREAAHAVGGTPLDRPEDIEVHPVTRTIFAALSNNKAAGNPMGSILKISEMATDPLSMRFKASTFFTGGYSTGVACPDNLAFDKHGNLWMTSDISDETMHRPPYTEFGNNSLFVIPMSGPHAGKALRVANAPYGAEFTGPMFSPDYRTLFLSVQHPGEGTVDIARPLSHWPDGGTSLPRPAVVAIQGPALDAIVLDH